MKEYEYIIILVLTSAVHSQKFSFSQRSRLRGEEPANNNNDHDHDDDDYDPSFIAEALDDPWDDAWWGEGPALPDPRDDGWWYGYDDCSLGCPENEEGYEKEEEEELGKKDGRPISHYLRADSSSGSASEY